MTAPVTIEEEAMTSRARLERAIGLHYPLSEDDVQDICDQGLACHDDFGPIGTPAGDGATTRSYRYCGDRWTVEYRDGRPHLVEAVEVPPDTPRSAVAEEESRCALVMDLLGMVRGSPLSDQEIAEYRADGWADILGESARRDREEPGRGSPVAEWHETGTRRLGRARKILQSPPIRPYTMQGGRLSDGDEWRLHRYMILTVCRIDDSTGECRIDHAEDIEAVLGEVAQLVTEARALLRVFDLDTDTYMDGVGITVRACLTDDPDLSHDRSLRR